MFSTGLAPAPGLWQSGFMKNKNMRELEKHWAEQQKKAAKLAKPAKPAKKQKTREGEPDGSQDRAGSD